jgi:choline dehydrogenase-like flavoprotein
MTYPEMLPFYGYLAKADNKAVQAFIAATKGGFGAMAADLRSPLFSFLYQGSGDPKSVDPTGVMFAQILREAYLSGIWDLPLALPLAEIAAPVVFMPNPDIYSKIHAPVLPPSRLYYDQASNSIKHRDGPIDCIVVGSGPGGATVAYQLQQAGKRVVLIEKGPWVVWGSMDTRSYSTLMFRQNTGATSNNAIIIRSGETMGGGTTVNIDLAFSPLEATIQARIEKWKKDGLIDKRFYTLERMAKAYEWVRETIKTRTLSQDELNQDNKVLWNGAAKLGIDPQLYHLNRYPVDYSPSMVDDKRDAARQLLLPAAQHAKNPLSLIPDASVDEVLFGAETHGPGVRATGVTVTMNCPWTDYGNTVVDPCNLQIPPHTTVNVHADNVVLAAGTIGTTKVLLNTKKNNPAVANPNIGKGLILHPSVPLVGTFNRQINLLEGLDSATFVDAFGVTPGFIYETMGGLPAYGAVLVPGSGAQVYGVLSKFNTSAGFGVMLVDTPHPDNCVTLDPKTGDAVLNYTLNDDDTKEYRSDKQRFRSGVAMGIRMMFMAGAQTVIVPTNENVLVRKDFDPMHVVFLTDPSQADLVEQNLQFIPNRTLLTSAHLQATNKMGPNPDIAVVSLRQRVWNVITRGEVPNLYVMDSSIFPTSVGANPMQSIYTFAKIFSDRFLSGMD